MAVLPTIPGLRFEVIVGDGPTSKEFEPPLGSDLNKNEHLGTSDGPIVHRFIESNSGSPFKILVIPEPGFEFDTRYDAMAFRLSIDGMSYRSSGFLWRKSEQQTNPSYVSRAITDRQPLEGPFVNLSFSEISRVEGAEDDAVQTDLKRLSSVGCIKIEVEYCWKGPETQEGPDHEGQPGRVIQGIAEKALVLNGGCHTHATSVRFESPWPKVRMPNITKHFGTICFYYRSQEALEKLNIDSTTDAVNPPCDVKEEDNEELIDATETSGLGSTSGGVLSKI